jgi:WD40 repeat protein
MKDYKLITEQIKLPTSNTDDDKALPYITCLICNHISIVPKMCPNCESLFCLDCIDKHMEESKLCPCCKEFTYSMTRPNKTIQKIYRDVKVTCPACKDIVYYTEILVHFNHCKKITKKAVCNQCKFTDTISNMETHECDECLSPLQGKKSNFEEMILGKLSTMSNKIEELTESLEGKERRIEMLEKELRSYKVSTNEKMAVLRKSLDEKELYLAKIELKLKGNGEVDDLFEDHEVECFDEVNEIKPREVKKSRISSKLEGAALCEKEKDNLSLSHRKEIVMEKTITDKRKPSFYVTEKKEIKKEYIPNQDYSQHKPKESDSSVIKQMECDNWKSLTDTQSEYDGIAGIKSKNSRKQFSTGIDVSTLQGHTNGVYCLTQIQWEKDNTTIASGSEDNTIIIWNIDSVQNSRVLSGHIGSIRCLIYVKWSKDQNTIASGSDDNTIRIWNIDTEQTIKVLRGHTNGVHSLIQKEDKDGECRILISGGGLFDSTIRLWNLDTDQCYRVIKGHIGCVRCLVQLDSPDTLVSSSDDGTLRVWNLNSNNCIGVLNGHTNGVHCVIFMKWDINNCTIVSGSWDNTIRVWDIEKDKCTILQGHSNGVNCLVQLKWEKDMQTILSGSWDKSIRLWNVVTEQCLKVINGHTGSVKCLVQLDVDYEQPVVISGSYDKTLRIWHDF